MVVEIFFMTKSQRKNVLPDKRIEPATVPYQANAHPIELPRPALVKKYFHAIKLLHANVQRVYSVYKSHMALVKALVQVYFPVHALSEH